MLDGWPASLIYGNIHSVPGKTIQTIHICGETIFRHHLLVGVTTGAKIRFVHPKLLRAWVLDIMHPMAGNTYWHVRIGFLLQSIAMNA
jgi:hypothetical protein